MDLRQPSRWEGEQVRRTPALELLFETGGLGDQALHVDRHAARPVGLELLQALSELGDRASLIASAPVVEANTNLQIRRLLVADQLRLFDLDRNHVLVLIE